mmetsp:Transcript_21059/g.33593  ORF Transcript_21059/g.33593 Transcript_21059/m.33593 type:complete len:311 (-) Transcript_21059:88-1020(-)
MHSLQHGRLLLKVDGPVVGFSNRWNLKTFAYAWAESRIPYKQRFNELSSEFRRLRQILNRFELWLWRTFRNDSSQQLTFGKRLLNLLQLLILRSATAIALCLWRHVWIVPIEHQKSHCTERPDVYFAMVSLTLHYFWCHERSCAHDTGKPIRWHDRRQSKVTNLDEAFRINEKIRRLHVSVGHVLRMKEIQSKQDLTPDAEIIGFVAIFTFTRQHLQDRVLAFIHDKVAKVRIPKCFHQSYNVRMKADPIPNILLSLGIFDAFVWLLVHPRVQIQDLHCDFLVGVAIDSRSHLSKRALAELPPERILRMN